MSTFLVRLAARSLLSSRVPALRAQRGNDLSSEDASNRPRPVAAAVHRGPEDGTESDSGADLASRAFVPQLASLFEPVALQSEADDFESLPEKDATRTRSSAQSEGDVSVEPSKPARGVDRTRPTLSQTNSTERAHGQPTHNDRGGTRLVPASSGWDEQDTVESTFDTPLQTNGHRPVQEPLNGATDSGRMSRTEVTQLNSDDAGAVVPSSRQSPFPSNPQRNASASSGPDDPIPLTSPDRKIMSNPRTTSTRAPHAVKKGPMQVAPVAGLFSDRSSITGSALIPRRSPLPRNGRAQRVTHIAPQDAVVNVVIERLEIRARPESSSPPTRRAGSGGAPAMTLDQYLRRRSQEQSP